MKETMSTIGMLLISFVMLFMMTLRVESKPAGDFAKPNNATMMNGTMNATTNGMLNGTSLLALSSATAKPQPGKRSIKLSELTLVRQSRSHSQDKPKQSLGEDDYDEETVRQKRKTDKDYYDDYQEPPPTPAAPPPEVPPPEPETPPPTPEPVTPPPKPTPKPKGKRSAGGFKEVQSLHKRSPDDEDDYGEEPAEEAPAPEPAPEPEPAPPADPDDDYGDDSRKK